VSFSASASSPGDWPKLLVAVTGRCDTAEQFNEQVISAYFLFQFLVKYGPAKKEPH